MKKEITWITGASSGIGKEIVHLFVQSEMPVAASSRNIELLEKLKEGLGSKKSLLNIVQCDVSDHESVVNAYNKISKDFKVTGLINNAGITSFKLATEDSIEDIQRIINTNLLGAVYTIRAVIPEMIARNHGTIINTISVAAKKIFTNSSIYSASKSGLAAYTDVLREELRKHNIKIINILPGATKTPIWPNSALEKFSDRMMSPADVASMIFKVYTLDGNIVPEEITLRPIKGDL